MGKDNNIPVLDSNNKFLSYTNPAKSRILIKNGRAKVFCRDPFILQLKGEVGDDDMAIPKQQESRRSKLIVNFSKYFQENEEVFVQNMLNSQISMSFKGMSGEEYHVVIPKTRRPYNLTMDVPVEIIKTSPDFRKLVTRSPQALRPLTEDEYMEYYDRLSERNSTTIDEEIGKALNLKSRLQNKQQMPSERLQRKANQELEEAMEEAEKAPEINPTVVGLCVKAGKDQGPMRIKAGDFVEELEMLEKELSVEDWEYISSKGVYKSVKNFANKMLESLLDEEEDDL